MRIRRVTEKLNSRKFRRRNLRIWPLEIGDGPSGAHRGAAAMLMQVLIYIFFVAFIALAILGHKLLAQALVRPGAWRGPTHTDAASNRDGRIDRLGMRTLSTVMLEATQSC